jgi:hypothetical protein
LNLEGGIRSEGKQKPAAMVLRTMLVFAAGSVVTFAPVLRYMSLLASKS